MDANRLRTPPVRYCAGKLFRFSGEQTESHLIKTSRPRFRSTRKAFRRKFPMTSVSESAVRHIPGPPLRKLIRCKATKAFLTEQGAWTKDMASAAVFEHHAAAVAVKRQLQLDGQAELYYSFEHPRRSEWDFTMDL